jgi:hypothetical protein
MPCTRNIVFLVSALFMALALPHARLASADPQTEAQRALIQRQQQSDAFALQLRQSQQMLNAGGFAQQQKLETLNLEQRQHLQNLNDQQLMQLQPTPEGALPAESAHRSGYQQQRLGQERQMQLQNFERQSRQLEREQKSASDAQ